MKQIQFITPNKSVWNYLIFLGWTEGRAQVLHFAFSNTHVHFLANVRVSFLTTGASSTEEMCLNIEQKCEVCFALRISIMVDIHYG